MLLREFRSWLYVVRLFVLFLLSHLAFISAHALDSVSDHMYLWYQCLGVNDEKSEDTLRRYLKDFSNTIDDAAELQGGQIRDRLRQKIPDLFERFLGDFTSLGHRYFFHWGYNVVDPGSDRCEGSKAFRKAIDDKLSDMQGDPKPTDEDINLIREAIFEIVKDEWVRRNQRLHRATVGAFGLPHQRTTALATIIYEIHVLADYTTERTEPFGPLRYHVQRELIERGIKRLLRGTQQAADGDMLAAEMMNVVRDPIVHGTEIAKMLSKEEKKFRITFRHVRDVIELRPDQRRALKIILILKKKLPELLCRSFGKTLAKKRGIIISYQKGIFRDLF